MKAISMFCKYFKGHEKKPSDKEILEHNMREHPNYWKLKTEKEKEEKLLEEFTEDIYEKRRSDCFRTGSGYQPNASKGDFLMPPDHEMTPEEVKAYKSECVSESTKEWKEDGSNMFKDCDTHPIPNPLRESTKEDTKKKCYCNACYVGYECHCSTVESTKEDHDKCQLDIINPAYLEDLADVLTDGEEVYGLNNWRGLKFSRIIASMLRHMTAIQKGEDIDPDSGHPHAAHIAANAMFLHWWQANGFSKGKQDDRRWANV